MMTPEDRLDALITEGADHRSGSDLADHLAVTRILRRLNAMEVPSEATARLNQRFAQALAQQGEMSSTSLRSSGHLALTRLVAARWRVVVASLVVLGLALWGAMLGVNHSLPGDPLYGIRQFEQQIALNNAANPVDASQIALQQLQTSLDDLQAIVNQQRDDNSLLSAIMVVSQQTTASQNAVNQITVVADQAQAQADLQKALDREHQVLQGILPKIDWPGQVATTAQLGAIGVTIPHITNIVGTPGGDGYHITITGTALQANARLYIDGHALAQHPLTLNAAGTGALSLTGIVPYSAIAPGKHAIGIQNPDNTATQAPFTAIYQSGDDRGGAPSPTAGQATKTPSDDKSHTTATPGDDHGGHPTGTPSQASTEQPGDGHHNATPSPSTTPGGHGDGG